MKCQSYLVLLFAFLSVIFFLLLIFLRIPFPLYPLMSWQDVLDILTPLVLLPVYRVLFKRTSNEPTSSHEETWFILFAALWASGQGMHLGANSVTNLAEHLAKTGGLNILDSSIYELTYFFDEHLSHYLWQIGILGLAAVLVCREWAHPAGEKTVWWAAITGGMLYGLTTFGFTLEGQTLPIGVPFAIMLVLVIFILGRKDLGERPLRAFFLMTALVAVALLVAWILLWGFPIPQISEVGWI
jgi:hypothetical protein